MACNSVATSKATISQVLYSVEELKIMLAKIAGIEPSALYVSKSQDDTYIYVSASGTIEATITQEIVDGKINLDFSAYGSSATNQAILDELRAKFESNLVVAKQSNVLRKLAKLGKLSKIEQKANGVTARIEITI